MSSTINATAHGFVGGEVVSFSRLTGGSNLVEGDPYYVLAAGITADTFSFSLTDGGVAVTLDDDITDGDYALYPTYTTVVDGVMDPPTTPPTPVTPTLSTSEVSGIIRVRAVLVTSPEEKVRATELNITHKYGPTISPTGTAATNLFALTAHGLVASDQVRFTVLTGGAVLAIDTTYYVIATGLTADAFALSATAGGVAVDFTTDLTASTGTVPTQPDWSTPLVISLPENATEASIPALPSTVYAVRARQQDVFGNFSNFSTVGTVTSAAGNDSLSASLALLANDVQDGVITTTKLGPDAVTNDAIAPGAVTAESLAAVIVLAGTFKTAETGNRRVEMDSAGVRLIAADESPVVTIPTNGNPVYVSGEVTASALTSTTSAEFRTAASLASSSVMTAQSGIATPSAVPTLAASVDVLTLATSPTSVAAAAGLTYDTTNTCYWVACDPTVSPYYVAQKYDVSGVLLLSIAATGSTTTTTTTLGSTAHVTDTADGMDGSTNSHIAVPLTIPSGLTNVKITKVSAYFAGHSGSAQCRVGIWDDVSGTGNLRRESATFTAVDKGATGLGDSVQYNRALQAGGVDSGLSVTSGATYYAGFRRLSASEGFQFDKDDGAGKTTYSGDDTSGDGTGWGVYDSAGKPNVYITYTYDTDTRLETAPNIGIASDGTYIYTLDTLGNVWTYTIAGVYVSKNAIPGGATFAGTKTKAGLLWDATASRLVVVTSSGLGAAKFVRFLLCTVSSGVVTYASALTDTLLSIDGTTDTLRGGVRNGTELWVSVSGTVYAFTAATGARLANRDFGTSTTALGGVTHDGTQFRGWAIATPTKVWKFSNWDWTTASAVYWVGYAWYTAVGPKETLVGPRTSITMRRRERLQVTNAATASDSVRVYMKPVASDWVAGAGFLQVTDALTSRFLSTYLSATADQTVSGFTGGTPAEFRSAKATGTTAGALGWSLKGDGTVKLPPPKVTVYTSGTTDWVCPALSAGLRYIVVEVVGGGAGGAGSAASTAGNSSYGSGGGGGGYTKKLLMADLMTPGNNYAALVGAGGAGVSGATAANVGADSTFSGTGITTVIAKGGSGGTHATNAATGLRRSGGAGGVAGSGGDFNSTGRPGGNGHRSTTGLGTGGEGGDSFLGGGGIAATSGTTNSSNTGNAGGAYGGGGGGAMSQGGGAAATSGSGSAGVIIVTEYYA